MKKMFIIAFLAAFTSLVATASTYTWRVPITNVATEQVITLSSIGNLSRALVLVTAPYTCSVSTVSKRFAATCGPIGTNETSRFSTMDSPDVYGDTTATNVLYFPAKSKKIYIKPAANSVDSDMEFITIIASEGNASTSVKTYTWSVPVSNIAGQQKIALDSLNPLSKAIVTVPSFWTGAIWSVEGGFQAVAGTTRTNDLTTTTHMWASATGTKVSTNWFPVDSKNLYIQALGDTLSGQGATPIAITATEGDPIGQVYSWQVPITIQKGGAVQPITLTVADALTGVTVSVNGTTNLAINAGGQCTCMFYTVQGNYPATSSLLGSPVYTNNAMNTTTFNLTNGQPATVTSFAMLDGLKTKTLYFGTAGSSTNNAMQKTLTIKGTSVVIPKSRFIPF